jgi:hypothetical protein
MKENTSQRCRWKINDKERRIIYDQCDKQRINQTTKHLKQVRKKSAQVNHTEGV